jgi:transposase
VVIALVMTPAGLPLAYKVVGGNTSDKTTPFWTKSKASMGRRGGSG